MFRPTTSEYQCEVCKATFSNSSHLRRHAAIHTRPNFFCCQFCNKTFSRADSTRRHIKSCTARGGRPIPDPRQRGKKMHACDYCARAKRACNKGQPCETCQASKVECTYSRPGYGNAEREQQGLMSPVLKEESVYEPEETISDMSSPGNEGAPNDAANTRMRVEFLLNFTKPGKSSLGEFFFDPAAEDTPSAPSPIQNDFVQAFTDDFMDLEGLHPASEFSALNDFMWNDVSSPESFTMSLPDHDAIQCRVDELISTLSTAFEVAAQKPLSTTSHILSSLNILFTVDNVVEFTKLYFQKWHPNSTILHPPSFKIESASLPVLLAMCLIGATYTAPRDTAAIAHGCADMAETIIFEDPAFKRLLEADRSIIDASAESIQPVQAAFMMGCLQNWRNSTTSRRRARTRRHSDIISAVRALRLFSARNDVLSAENLNSKPFDWNEYIEAESRVRLMCWVFLVDCQYTIFFRYPPRVMMTEMTGHFPSSEDAFLATSSIECWRHLVDAQHLPRVSLSTCIKIILKEDWTPEEKHNVAQLSTLDFFTVLNAMNTVIYSNKQSHLGLYVMEPLSRALSRWKELWDLHMEHIDPQRLRRMGFFKNAVEFWHLTNLLLEENLSLDKSPSANTCDADSMAEINNLLERFEGVKLS